MKVTLLRTFVQNLPPQARLLILIGHNCLGRAIQHSNQLRPIRMVGRKPVQHIDQRHGIPAHRPSPGLGRETGLRICPLHLLRLVPPMSQKPGLRIAHVLIHQQQLLRNVVEILRLLKGDGVLGAKGRCHVRSVQPHLVGIDLFVPVSPARRPGLQGELVVNILRRLVVLRLLGHAINQKHGPSQLNLIQTMRVGMVVLDRSIFSYIFIDRSLDVAEVVPVGSRMPLGCHAIQQDSFFVSPVARDGSPSPQPPSATPASPNRPSSPRPGRSSARLRLSRRLPTSPEPQTCLREPQHETTSSFSPLQQAEIRKTTAYLLDVAVRDKGHLSGIIARMEGSAAGQGRPNRASGFRSRLQS